MAFPHASSIPVCPYIESEDLIPLVFVEQDGLSVPAVQGWWYKKASAAVLFFLASSPSQTSGKHCTA
jgi:hypothetical protein